MIRGEDGGEVVLDDAALKKLLETGTLTIEKPEQGVKPQSPVKEPAGAQKLDEP